MTKSNSRQGRGISRRTFLTTTTTVAAGATLMPGNSWAARKKALPQANKSGIEHVIVVMMENRSFDHFVGWIPGADGRQAGLNYPDRAGVLQPTYALAPDYQGCSHPDPDHSYQGGRVEYDNGACDGWLRAGNNDLYAIGYYTQNDLPFHAGAAQNWTTCDRYFSPIMASTYPNRFYQHAAQTDRLDNSLAISTLPTIWDRLAEHSLQGKYYFSDVPFLVLWGAKYLPIMHPISEFFDDCAAGTLPHVSFVDPKLLGEHLGITNDDHPYADIRNGQWFLSEIYNAVTSSPNWPNTVLVINYDEWGGFFDHVPPSAAPIPPADAALGSDGLRGFRVPAFVIAPWAQRGQVAHQIFDHTSVLRMIEWRWRLRPLTVRDATANNLADVLDFSRRNFNAPDIVVPPGPYGAPCPSSNPLDDEWLAVAQIAEQLGLSIF
jgi:phospholipase C